MNEKRKAEFLVEMTNAYLEAAMFADSPDGEDWSDAEWSEQAEREAAFDCSRFLDNVLFYHLIPEGNMNQVLASQMGHDFWLTARGHGAGFWDGDWEWIYDGCGNDLTDIAKTFPEEQYLWRDEAGLIRFEGSMRVYRNRPELPGTDYIDYYFKTHEDASESHHAWLKRNGALMIFQCYTPHSGLPGGFAWASHGRNAVIVMDNDDGMVVRELMAGEDVGSVLDSIEALVPTSFEELVDKLGFIYE
jgi:hypothetical protein